MRFSIGWRYKSGVITDVFRCNVMWKASLLTATYLTSSFINLAWNKIRCRIICKYVETETFALSDRFILWLLCVQSIQVNHGTISCEGGCQSASVNNTGIPPFTVPGLFWPSSEQTVLGPNLSQNYHVHTHTSVLLTFQNIFKYFDTVSTVYHFAIYL